MAEDEPKPDALIPVGRQRGLQKPSAPGYLVPVSSSGAARDTGRVDPDAEFDSVRDGLARLADGTEPFKARDRRTPARQDASTGLHLAFRLIASLVVLLFALGGFWVLAPSLAIFWFLFLLVAYPVVYAFTINAGDVSNRNLLELYKTGLKELPAIGRMLGGPSSKKNVS